MAWTCDNSAGRRPLRKHFQIVVAGRSANRAKRTGVLRRLQVFVEGLLVTAFIAGTLIAALVVGTTIALVLWIVVAIILVAVIIRVAFRRRLGDFVSDRTQGRDGLQGEDNR